LKVILWKFSKMPKWSFRLRVSAIFICCKIQRLQLADCSYSRFKIEGFGIIRDYYSFKFRCSVLPRRQIWTRLHRHTIRKSRSLLLCGANSHKSYMDQGDYWVIKFRSGMNLFDLIKLWTSWGCYWEEGVRWRWSQELYKLCINMSI